MLSIAGDTRKYTLSEITSIFIPIMSKEEPFIVTEMIKSVYALNLKKKKKQKYKHTSNQNILYRLVNYYDLSGIPGGYWGSLLVELP